MSVRCLTVPVICLSVSVAGLRVPAGCLMVVFIRPLGLILAAYLLGKKGLLMPLTCLIALYKALKATCGFLMIRQHDQIKILLDRVFRCHLKYPPGNHAGTYFRTGRTLTR